MAPERPRREKPDAPVTVDVDLPYAGEVMWSHLRMNHPEAIAGLLEDVQRGELSRDALSGLASPARLDAMLGMRWDAVRIPRIVSPMEPEPAPRGRRGTDPLRDMRRREQTAWEGALLAAGGKVALTIPDFEPKMLKFGPIYDGERSTAKLVLTSPTQCVLTASLPDGSPFKICKMTSFTGKIVMTTPDNKKLGIDKEVAKEPWMIEVKAGQDVWIECEFAERFNLFKSTAGMRKEVLHLRGDSAKINAPGAPSWGAKVPLEGRFLGKDLGVLAFPTHSDLQMITPKSYYMQVPHRLDLVVRLINTKDAVSGTFVAGSLPSGVSLQGTVTVNLKKEEMRDVKVPILVDRFDFKGPWHSNWGIPHFGTVRFEYGNGRSTEMQFSITKFPMALTWRGVGNCGSIRYAADMLIFSDGIFRFSAQCTNENWVQRYQVFFDGSFDGVRYVNAVRSVDPHCTEYFSYGFKRPIFEENYTIFAYKPFKLKISTRRY